MFDCLGARCDALDMCGDMYDDLERRETDTSSWPIQVSNRGETFATPNQPNSHQVGTVNNHLFSLVCIRTH